MTTSQLSPPVLIQDEQALRGLAKELRTHPHIAVDTESNSLYAYREQVCLIQFSIPEKDYLVDPLSLSDLSILEPIFSDPTREKVFHGAEYDLMCLKRDFGFTFANLFDTRLASRTLGRKRNGLQDLLSEAFGVQVNKRFQRANWGKRPLPQELLDYARYDTHYLLPLRHKLAQELQAANRWEEANEAFKVLTLVDPHNNGFDPNGFWRISNARKLTPTQLAILRELYLYRDSQARKLNRPHFKVAGDKSLLAIAQAMPENLEALGILPGMTPGQVRRYGKGVLKAVQRGHRAQHPKPPKSKHVDDKIVARYEKLHSWRKKTARKRGLESDVILPRDMLWDIARAAPRDLKSLEKTMAPLQWRFKKYGSQILKTLWGKTPIQK
jgi:ribonuclease D